MTAAADLLTIVPLVPNVPLPQMASARTRASVPPGYGVQEQCLPFTAASALGVMIRSPIRFGTCTLQQLPQGCRAFRSPLNKPRPDGSFADPRVFYVFDNPDCLFIGNAYEFKGVPPSGSPTASVREPGISFFDRDDQRDLIKLHLPYVWRTPEAIDTLFLPRLNANAAQQFDVLCGLVETDWYASPVNLVVRIPPGPLHVQIGEPVAQAIFVQRQWRRPVIDFANAHTQLNSEMRTALAKFDQRLAEDRSAYKVLARSAHGRMEGEKAK
jgi:hypothetical protein